MKLSEVMQHLEDDGEAGDWLRWIIGRGDRVRAFLWRRMCYKRQCQKPSWVLFLHVAGSNKLVTEAELLFRYPGVMRQLTQYLRSHLAIAREYGSIEKRFSAFQNTDYLSQGCRHCNALFGTEPLREDIETLWYALQEYLQQPIPDNFDDQELKCIFVLDLARLFDQ